MDINGRPDHIEDVLATLHTGCWFGWSDSKNKVYANLVIHSADDKPTESGLTTELVARQEAWDGAAYARSRQAEYPSLNELTVALWEGVVEERMASIMELEAQRQSVKAKYPK